jgi:hypothetical protein
MYSAVQAIDNVEPDSLQWQGTKLRRDKNDKRFKVKYEHDNTKLLKWAFNEVILCSITGDVSTSHGGNFSYLSYFCLLFSKKQIGKKHNYHANPHPLFLS